MHFHLYIILQRNHTTIPRFNANSLGSFSAPVGQRDRRGAYSNRGLNRVSRLDNNSERGSSGLQPRETIEPVTTPVTLPATDANAPPDPKTLTRANGPPLTDEDWEKHISGQRSSRATKMTLTYCFSLSTADCEKIVDDVAAEFAKRPGMADLIVCFASAPLPLAKEKGDASGLKDVTKYLEAWWIKDSKWADRFAYAHSGNAAIVREQTVRKLVFDGKSRVASATKQEEFEVDSGLEWDISMSLRKPVIPYLLARNLLGYKIQVSHLPG
jgi:hypothetical protein